MSPQIYWALLAMAFISGAFMPLQAGINGLLAKEVSSVLNAATISFSVGTAALLILAFWQRDTVSLSSFKSLHWWPGLAAYLAHFSYLLQHLSHHALALCCLWLWCYWGN